MGNFLPIISNKLSRLTLNRVSPHYRENFLYKYKWSCLKEDKFIDLILLGIRRGDRIDRLIPQEEFAQCACAEHNTPTRELQSTIANFSLMASNRYSSISAYRNTQAAIAHRHELTCPFNLYYFTY